MKTKLKHLLNYGIRFIFLLFVFLVLGISACEKDSLTDSLGTNELVSNDTLTIVFQDTLRNPAEKSWLTFSSVVADSRCPIGVVCVWEGNAEIAFMFFDGEKSIDFNLNSNPMFVTDTTVLGFTFSLLVVNPYPHIDSLYTESDYSAKVLFSKK